MLKVMNQPLFSGRIRIGMHLGVSATHVVSKTANNDMLDTRISDKSQVCGTWTDVISEVKTKMLDTRNTQKPWSGATT